MITAATKRAHRATWWVYPEPGNTDRATRIRHQKTMRGRWGYDVTCSCGWDSKTGGGLRRYVAEKLEDHRYDAQIDQETTMPLHDIPKLAGLAEVAKLAGVSRNHALRLTKRPGFPEPVQHLAMGPVYVEADVLTYLEIPRPTGRPRRPQANGATVLAEDITPGQTFKSANRWYTVAEVVERGAFPITLSVDNTKGERHLLVVYKGTSYPLARG
jgi:predicted DNA-binding transcriptional regulator AlpA